MYNLLFGGAAGQGVETTVAVLEQIIKRSGSSIFTVKDFMSRVRGGHNFSLLRFGNTPIRSHTDELTGIIALTEETVELHRDQLIDGGFILCDSQLKIDDPRAIKIDMAVRARRLGNPRVSGIIAVGILMKLFGFETNGAEEVLAKHIKKQYLNINVQALHEGFDLVERRFDNPGGNFAQDMILTGSQAMALGALAGGLKFYSAYPMSPSTALMEYLAPHAHEARIVVEQAEDEIAAAMMAVGASYTGARAMTGTSGGGFALMVETLGLSGMAEIPTVFVDVQRPGPVTGLPTRTEQSDLKFVVSASQGEFPRLVIAVRHHADAFYQTIRALNLAEKYQIPVILLSDQYLGDASGTVPRFDLNKVRPLPVGNTPADLEPGQEYLRYRVTESGISPRLLPGQSEHLVLIDSDEHDEKGWITESAEVRISQVDKRARKLKLLETELQEPDFIGTEDFHTLLLGWGSTYGPIEEAVATLNQQDSGGYAALLFGDVYPLPQRLLKEKASQAKEIIDVEQNSTAQFAGLVREYSGIKCDREILKYDGRQIMAKEIVSQVLQQA
ncbi:2-oxoacid:acceptor oxidoreductase subunit alpha [Oscillospiraceae bacterium HV4-5-C5C]|nr:2-oxoacid:acceptor oxidoreductase subunit alpha [Oscillospiraceae bacterium HV4-5-C5C]